MKPARYLHDPGEDPWEDVWDEDDDPWPAGGDFDEPTDEGREDDRLQLPLGPTQLSFEDLPEDLWGAHYLG